MNLPLKPLPAHTRHGRNFESYRYVYPVLSRRSGGISLGINLNPSKNCNYDCPYCQVDRSSLPSTRISVNLNLLALELDNLIREVSGGTLNSHPRFQDVTDPDLLQLKDIAFSGDGEPTLCPEFPDCVQLVLSRVQALKNSCNQVKTVLISNGTALRHQIVFAACGQIVSSGGEVWLKLDAVTETAFKKVYGTGMPMGPVMEGIARFGQEFPIVFQTMVFLEPCGKVSLDTEPFIRELQSLKAKGVQIQGVQLYTLARVPKNTLLRPLPGVMLESMAERVRRETGLVIETFQGMY